MKATVSAINVSPLHTKGGFWARLRTPKRWLLNEDVTVTIGGATHVIKKGLVFDFASVPRIVKWCLPDDAVYSAAALFHDDAYKTGYISKWLADALLAELLAQDKMKLWGLIMWAAVALFGKSAWNSHRKTHIKQ